MLSGLAITDDNLWELDWLVAFDGDLLVAS